MKSPIDVVVPLLCPVSHRYSSCVVAWFFLSGMWQAYDLVAISFKMENGCEARTTTEQKINFYAALQIRIIPSIGRHTHHKLQVKTAESTHLSKGIYWNFIRRYCQIISVWVGVAVIAVVRMNPEMSWSCKWIHILCHYGTYSTSLLWHVYVAVMRWRRGCERNVVSPTQIEQIGCCMTHLIRWRW